MLIVNGDNDLQVVPANADALAAAQPAARKTIVPGMTHVLKSCDERDLQGQLRAVYYNANLPLSPELGPLLARFHRRPRHTARAGSVELRLPTARRGDR